MDTHLAGAVAEALDEAKIPYTPAVGAMSVWVDLRAALTEKTWEAERKAWNDLVDGHKVVLTPGAHFCQTLTLTLTVTHKPHPAGRLCWRAGAGGVFAGAS